MHDTVPGPTTSASVAKGFWRKQSVTCQIGACTGNPVLERQIPIGAAMQGHRRVSFEGDIE